MRRRLCVSVVCAYFFCRACSSNPLFSFWGAGDQDALLQRFLGCVLLYACTFRRSVAVTFLPHCLVCTSQADPKGSDPHEDRDRVELLKQAFQLLWALAMHTPLPVRDMAQGAGIFNTMVSVVSRFYNSAEMEEFQVHKEAMMLMEKMN
ncbi:unnamed protein product [Ectocarpus sp. 4 AP-2014]